MKEKNGFNIILKLSHYERAYAAKGDQVCGHLYSQ